MWNILEREETKERDMEAGRSSVSSRRQACMQPVNWDGIRVNKSIQYLLKKHYKIGG